VSLQVACEQNSNSPSLSVVHYNPLADGELRDPMVVCTGWEKEKEIDFVPENSKLLCIHIHVHILYKLCAYVCVCVCLSVHMQMHTRIFHGPVTITRVYIARA
jgi:hypothetical protein